jgi:phage protein D
MKSQVRQPRGIAMVNGIRMAWMDIEVNNNGYYQADAFRVTIPVKGQPSGVDRSWWAGLDTMEVEIYTGFPSDVEKYGTSDLDLMITGRVDNLPHELVNDVIILTGRDYTADLIDTKTSNKWPNRTSSGIATDLANKYGLTPVVTATNTKTGVYYTHDHAKMEMGMSEWDLLAWLAKEELFDVFIVGRELHFQPKETNPPIYDLKWVDATDTNTKQFIGQSLTFDRNLTLAKDVIVHVKSWNQKQKKGFYKTAKATRNKDKTVSRGWRDIGKPQEFTYTIPNLTPEQAQQKAYAILRDITKHQIRMAAVGLPATNDLTPRHIIRVSGTGAYDQDFNPYSITRRLSIRDGYTMDIVAKNHDVNSVVPISGGGSDHATHH